ncbi:MAG: lamin tail domain-containing protein [Bacteroidales bacterium]|nr:lamin tail domain-containing protein [Bacteroidales bacterium]
MRKIMEVFCIVGCLCISCQPWKKEEIGGDQSYTLNSEDLSWNDENAYPTLLSINELLFDPLKDGVDYVEIVNVSDHAVDLSGIYLCNRSAAGVLSAGKVLSQESCLLSPGGYCLLSSDTARVAADYGFPADSLRLQIKSFPSFPNESGCVVLTDRQGVRIDEFPYTKYLHHPLVSVREGIALEKMHPGLPSAKATCWTSAAADAGFGTPGRQNSQYAPWLFSSEYPENRFFASSEIIYPKRLNTDSQWLLYYYFRDGCVANVVILYESSRPCFTLADNLLLGSRGVLKWSGLDNEGQPVPFGRYLVQAQCHTVEGEVFRQYFVVAVLP